MQFIENNADCDDFNPKMTDVVTVLPGLQNIYGNMVILITYKIYVNTQ